MRKTGLASSVSCEREEVSHQRTDPCFPLYFSGNPCSHENSTDNGQRTTDNGRRTALRRFRRSMALMTMCAGFALTAAAQQNGRIKIAGPRTEGCTVYVIVKFQQNDCTGMGTETVCIPLPTDGTYTEIQTPNPAYLFLRSIEAWCDDECTTAPDLTWSCPNGPSNTASCCGSDMVIKGTVDNGFRIAAP